MATAPKRSRQEMRNTEVYEACRPKTRIQDAGDFITGSFSRLLRPTGLTLNPRRRDLRFRRRPQPNIDGTAAAIRHKCSFRAYASPLQMWPAYDVGLPSTDLTKPSLCRNG